MLTLYLREFDQIPATLALQHFRLLLHLSEFLKWSFSFDCKSFPHLLYLKSRRACLVKGLYTVGTLNVCYLVHPARLDFQKVRLSLNHCFSFYISKNLVLFGDQLVKTGRKVWFLWQT